MFYLAKKLIDEDSTDVSTDDETVNRKSKKKRQGKSSVQRVNLIAHECRRNHSTPHRKLY